MLREKCNRPMLLIKRQRAMLLEVYKCIHELGPHMFSQKSRAYDYRDPSILTLPKYNTITHEVMTVRVITNTLIISWASRTSLAALDPFIFVTTLTCRKYHDYQQPLTAFPLFCSKTPYSSSIYKYIYKYKVNQIIPSGSQFCCASKNETLS